MIKKEIELINVVNTEMIDKKSANDSEYCRASELAKKFNVSVSAIWSWTRNGNFPQPVKLTPKCTVWILSEVQEWLDSRIATRKVA